MNVLSINVSCKKSTSGFTLLEVVVVMFFVGLLSLLTSDALFKTLDLRDRMGALIDRAQDGLITQKWYENTIKGIIRGTEKFEAEKDKIKGDTIMSLDGDIGTPMAFTLEITDDDKGDGQILKYTGFDEDSPLTIAHFDNGSGAFSYANDSLEWNDKWPPDFGAESDFAPFPLLIRFQAQKGDKQITMIASPMLTKTIMEKTAQ